MPIIKLSAAERRRVSAFFTCLVLAIVAWMFTVLSNQYKYTVKEVLNFKNTPQKRPYHSLQSDTVNVTVNGTGWEMLFSKMNIENKNITVDLRTLENKNYVVLSNQVDAINGRKEVTQQISGFNPDTLYFDFSNRREKKVPVHLISAIHYQHQFSQSGNVSVKPSYVIVNGPADVIGKITEWRSDTLKAHEVNETISSQVNLQPVREGNLSVYPKSVQVTIPVEEFTEKTLQIPVKLVNSGNDNVRVFPQKVKVTFTVALKRYAEMDEDFFEATADLNLWRHQGYKVLPVVLTKVPQYCKIAKIDPAYIDFIIKK